MMTVNSRRSTSATPPTTTTNRIISARISSSSGGGENVGTGLCDRDTVEKLGEGVCDGDMAADDDTVVEVCTSEVITEDTEAAVETEREVKGDDGDITVEGKEDEECTITEVSEAVE